MPEQTVLAFDFGTQRIGIAVGDIAIGHAHPLEVIQAINSSTKWQRITQLLKEWQPIHLVVGLPAHQDGKKHAMVDQVHRFAQKLQTLSPVPLSFVDEQYSSTAAAMLLHEVGIYGKTQQPFLDKVAAQVILEAWFDERGSVQSPQVTSNDTSSV